jgi:hypothetical protein
MKRREVLQSVSFGEQVAEDERKQLAAYFVRTAPAQQLIDGKVDVVYAPKGAGKSALYGHLITTADDFEGRGIVVIACEKPLGEPVFRDLVTELPNPSEGILRHLWSLYFAMLVGHEFRKRGFSDARGITETLQDADLLPAEFSLRAVWRAAISFVQRAAPSGMEGGVEFAPGTLQPSGVTWKILFRDPTVDEKRLGRVSVASLLAKADEVLRAHNLNVWLTLDRLDVAFPRNSTLEEIALRALFRTYLDLKEQEHIRLKIFLRNDIWERITKRGFPEASHIRRAVRIRWERKDLVHLVCRRLVTSKMLRDFFGVSQSDVLATIDSQASFLNRVIQRPPDLASDKDAIDWLLMGIRDGTGQAAPRELIHLLVTAQMKQLDLWRVEEEQDDGTHLISARALQSALPDVSQSRLDQTLYAEYPDVERWVVRLRGENPAQSLVALGRLWETSPESARAAASTLIEVGFFESLGTASSPTYQVPILYRSALSMPSSGSWATPGGA